jgi:hypothetical protein
MTMTKQEREQFYADRKAAGLKIDPATAEVEWEYANCSDPYGLDPFPPPYEYNVGRVYFARAPGGDWVALGDLPEATLAALNGRRRAALGPSTSADDDINFLDEQPRQ